MALSENNGLPSFDVLLHSQSYVADLEARLRHTQHTCSRFQYKLHNVQAALQKELQCRLIFQQQVQIEKQKHSETIKLFKIALQDLQEASINLQQERNMTEMQKKVISDQEDLIGIYQAGYQLVEAQSETAFTSGAVIASLPAMRSEESIRHEYRTTETSASPGGHQNFSKRVMSALPVTDSNNYGFSYVTDLSSGPKPASTTSLPVETKPSGFTLVGKGAAASLPRIDEVDCGHHADFEFVMNPDFQFPTSSLRDTPCMAGINERNDHGCHDHDKGADAIVSAGLGTKRAAEEEGVEQHKRQRKPKSTTITPAN
jgi:hypothetical protein